MKSFVKFRSKQTRRRTRSTSPWSCVLERLESRSLLSATIAAPATQTTLEDMPKAISGMLFTSSIDPVTVTLSVIDGTLTLNSGVAGGVTAAQITGNGTSSVSITAIVANVNTTLANASGLTYLSSADFSGSDTLAININNLTDSVNATTTLTVTSVNDTPSFTKGTNQIVLEDAGAQSVSGWATSVSAGPNEATQTVDFQASNDNNSLFSVQPAISASGTLTYPPAANQNGTATVTVLTHDNGGVTNGGHDTSATRIFTITVTAVNDVPSFTKGANQTVLEDGGAQSVPGWAININAGTNEAAQAVNFIVNSDNPGLFSVQPAVAADGTLSYTPALNANGTTTVTVFIHDNGGTTNGGVDTSASQTFTIAITAVNDVPSFTKGPNQSPIGFAAQTVTSWATNILAGPSDESAQTLNFLVTSNNPALFSVPPLIAANGTLTYTPTTNANGVAIVSVQIKDNGGTTNGGVDTSAVQLFTITIGTGALPVVPNAVYTAAGGSKMRAFVVNGLLTVQINGIPYSTYAPASIVSLTFNGGSKNDEINLSELDPLVYTSLASVKINGGAGNDSLVGSFAKDSIDGGSGNDTLAGGLNNDTLIGNAGTDLLVETADVDLTLDDTSLTGLGTDKLVTIENASLTSGDTGNAFDASAFTRGAVTLIGGAGNDTLTGGSKNDAISGRDGNDELTGGAGNDTLLGGFGEDTLSGGLGNDVLVGGFDDDTLDGGDGRDTIVGGQGGAARGGNGVSDAGDDRSANPNNEINEAFAKLFAWE